MHYTQPAITTFATLHATQTAWMQFEAVVYGEGIEAEYYVMPDLLEVAVVPEPLELVATQD